MATETQTFAEAGAEMSRSLERKLVVASDMLDPLGRALALDKLLDEVDQLRAKVVAQRGIAIYDANQAGVGLNSLAAALTKSKTLMQQQVALGRKLVEDDEG